MNIYSTKHASILAIFIIYVSVTAAYAISNPLFEAPDEPLHFAKALYIAQNGSLPVAGTPESASLGQEVFQPPLYYFLGSLLIRPFASSLAETSPSHIVNPFIEMGNTNATANINLLAHTSDEIWPWADWAVAVHILRFFSAFLGLITLLSIYQSAKLIWPRQHKRAILSVGVVAFLPQFNFLHSYVNNDAAIICFASLSLWQLIHIWNNETSLWLLTLLGIFIGLAALSKTTGLLLAAYTFGFLIIKAILKRQYFTGMLGAIYVVVVGSIISGWFFLRNWKLYGDPTGVYAHIAFLGNERNVTIAEVILNESSSLRWSFIGVFGWFNLQAPILVHWVWYMGLFLAVLGILRSIRWNWLALLLSAWFICVYAGLITFMLRTSAAQGRLLFPSLLPLALGLSYGLSNFKKQSIVNFWLVLAFLTTVYVPLILIPDAYNQDYVVAEVPANAIYVNKKLTKEIELLAYDLPSLTAFADEHVVIDFYWRAVAPVVNTPELIIELFGRNNDSIAKFQSYHGKGLFPASLWPTNQIIFEQVHIPIYDYAVTPTEAKITSWILDGEAIDLGFIKVLSQEDIATQLNENSIAQFDGSIELVSAQLSSNHVKPGDTLFVDIIWQIVAKPQKSYSTLVHLGKSGQPPLAQGDAIPIQGNYPTHWWEPHETFSDNYTISIPPETPPGQYTLQIGFYDENFLRSSVIPDSGDRTFILDTVTIR